MILFQSFQRTLPLYNIVIIPQNSTGFLQPAFQVTGIHLINSGITYFRSLEFSFIFFRYIHQMFVPGRIDFDFLFVPGR